MLGGSDASMSEERSVVITPHKPVEVEDAVEAAQANAYDSHDCVVCDGRTHR